MGLAELFVLAVGLSMDALRCLSVKDCRLERFR